MGLARTNDGPFTMISGEALADDRLVKISASTLVYADAGDEPIGITKNAVASGAYVACDFLMGTFRRVTASAAISAGAAIYAANDGKVASTAVGKQLGIAIDAATGDGGVITALVWGPRGGMDFAASRHSVVDFFDDFFAYDNTATTGDWVVVEDAGASGGDVIADGAGGLISIGCDGDDNDECYVSSANEAWLFQTDKRLFFEAYVKLTEANTDDANIIVGLSDTVAANSLLDNGAGPMASYDGAVFFKVDGGKVWQAETSNAGTQVTDTNAGAFTTATWTRLSFYYDYNDGVTANVYFYVNGTLGATNTLTISGLAEMHILLGVKAGGDNEEALVVDYVHVAMER